MPDEIFYADLRLPADGTGAWAGMGDYRLVSADGSRAALPTYVGEPAHGDSYHRLSIDGHPFPGYAWGDVFAFSPCARWLAFAWTTSRQDRRTVVADLVGLRFHALAATLSGFRLSWPTIAGREGNQHIVFNLAAVPARRWTSYVGCPEPDLAAERPGNHPGAPARRR